MAVMYLYVCAIILCEFFVITQSSRTEKGSSSRIRLMVSSLQEQITILQKEQERNRNIIKSLETRLDEELLRKNAPSRKDVLESIETGNNFAPENLQSSIAKNEITNASVLGQELRFDSQMHQKYIKFPISKTEESGQDIQKNLKYKNQADSYSERTLNLREQTDKKFLGNLERDLDNLEKIKILEHVNSSSSKKVFNQDNIQQGKGLSDVIADSSKYVTEGYLDENIHSQLHDFSFDSGNKKVDFSFLDKKLKDLQEQLSAVARDSQKEIQEYSNDNLRAEWESLRNEVQKLRQELESQKSKKEEEWSQLAELKSSHVTTKWLQKTVEDVRREMSELAAALNISMALRQSQQLEAVLNRVRSDVVSLRSELERQNAGRVRQSAAMEQLKEELQEVRLVAQTVSIEHQQLVEEVSALKEELFGLRSYPNFKDLYYPGSESSGLDESTETADGSGSEENSLPFVLKENFFGRRFRHDHHFSQEITTMRQHLVHLQKSQMFLDKELRSLKHNYSISQALLSNMQKTNLLLSNQTSSWINKQSHMIRDIEELKEKLAITDERTFQNGRNIINITEAVTGMDKVHSSTVQLFEALESLEAEYSKKIGELQKDVSKFEFNVAQVQSAFDILRHDHSSHYIGLKSLKEDFSSLQDEVRKNHFRLISVQNEVLNLSLNRCTQNNQETLQDLKLANIELRLAKIAKSGEESNRQLQTTYSKLLQKVDKESLKTLQSSLSSLAQELKNVSGELKRFNVTQHKVKHEMMKFIRRLPSDCSMGDVPNPATRYDTGVYLIHLPDADNAQEIFCDMSTTDSRWTVIQRRQDGTEDFFRNWSDYKLGFGSIHGEFWLGNDIIHKLTQHKNYTLRIDMWDVYDRYTYAEYKNFHVASEEELYRLEVGSYAGNASDALKYHHNMAFSTKDRDNDVSSTHCAMYYSGGWWYQHCQYVNVNGRYAMGMTWYDSENHDWIQLAKVEMKIRIPSS